MSLGKINISEFTGFAYLFQVKTVFTESVIVSDRQFLACALRGFHHPLGIRDRFAIGFSHMTCLPASREAMEISACESLGVRT